MSVKLRIDGDGPLYRQIRRSIADPIIAGHLVPGTRLPSEHEMMEMFKTSRMTVNRALQMLSDEGLVVRHRRSGTFVARQLVEHAVLDLRDIADEITGSRAVYGYHLLSRRRIKADRVTADELGVRKGSALLHLVCRHDGDGRPFVIEDRLINLATVPAAVDQCFSEMPPSRWLLKTVPWSKAEHAVLALNATLEIARSLEISPGDACLSIERRTWFADKPVTFARLTYPGNRHRLVGRFTPGG